MKDKENQVFGGYGNHDFPTEIKQERPNNTTSQNEKIVYGSLITSTKCYNCIHFPLCFAQKGGANLELASENDCCYYQSKLPEDSVVLTREEYEVLKIKEKEKHWLETCMSVWENAKIDSSKKTAEKDFNAIIRALEERKERVKAFYGLNESVGVDIAIRTVKELAKQCGVEIKE